MHIRSYRHDRDAPAVADLLGSLPVGYRHRLEAGWRLAASGFENPAENRLFIGAGGTLLGIVAWQQSWAVLDLWLRPGGAEAAVADMALTWARERFAQLDAARGCQLPYWIEVGEGDGLRRDLAARHGFDMVGDARYVMMRHDLEAKNGSRRQRPVGITIRPLAGPAEVPAYVAAHRAAFESEAMTVAWRSATLTMPGYEPELDLVAVADDGTITGFCVTWLDRRCRAAQAEPVGVVPQFRRSGVARALLDEAVRRAAQHDATALYAEPDDVRAAALATYADAGFRRVGWTERRGRTGFGE
jgi:ribosomal protein S18 acetylase RimI-like enzyme